MDKEKWLDALNDDARELRAMTIAIREETKEIREEIKLLREDVKESKRKSDAAWELVVMTREQIREEMAYLREPIWKKWFGTT